MKSGLVAVVIPCRNAEAWVAETVRSSVDQGDIVREVVLVDDGSTDRSVDAAEAAAPGRLTILRQPASGVSRARNIGTAATTAPFVQYLDADDVLAPGTLEARVAALEAGEGDVAYCDWVHWQRQDDGTFLDGLVEQRVLGPRPEIDLLTDAWWPPGALLYRRTIVERVLPWREDLPVIQDARFQQDAAARGAAFAHVPAIGLRYRETGGPSLSRRDPSAFLRDCLQNVHEFHEAWEAAGAIDAERHAALCRVYTYVLRSTFRREPSLFDEALSRVRRLDPHFLPDGPRTLRWLSRAIGYRAAEHVAAAWRAARP